MYVCLCVLLTLCLLPYLNPDYTRSFTQRLDYVGEDFRSTDTSGSGDLYGKGAPELFLLAAMEEIVSSKSRAGPGPTAGLVVAIDLKEALCIQEGMWIEGAMSFPLSRRGIDRLLLKQVLGSFSCFNRLHLGERAGRPDCISPQG